MTTPQARASGHVAVVRDVGLVSVPRSVLDKPGPLTGAERAVLERHPLVGARIVSAIPGLSHVGPWVRAAHERWDGRGYPDSLEGDEVPLIDRVAYAGAAYEAMTRERPYRPALSPSEARAELRAGAGTQFCERTVRALLDTLSA
jgi:HD-GYP domain-containing protein (c-di-GMP phosphodiesterase class II)